MKMTYLLNLVFLVIIFSCQSKEDTETTNAPDIQEEIDQSISDAHDHVQQFADGSEETDTLLKPADDSWQSYLATEMWEFTKGMISGGNAADHLEGRWIDFDESFTYSTGKWENVITTGEWSVTNEGVVHMRPTDGTDRESEWRIRKKLNSMVWSGTPKFGNNQTQYFLVRVNKLPKQIY